MICSTVYQEFQVPFQRIWVLFQTQRELENNKSIRILKACRDAFKSRHNMFCRNLRNNSIEVYILQEIMFNVDEDFVQRL